MSFDFFTRLQTHPGGSNLCDRFSEAHFDSTPLKLFFGINTQVVFERGEHFFPPVHNDYPRLFCGELVVIAGENIIKRSESAPAVSTPVGPAPTITKSSAPSSIRVGSLAAASNRSKLRLRSLTACMRMYRGNACSAAPGVLK